MTISAIRFLSATGEVGVVEGRRSREKEPGAENTVHFLDPTTWRSQKTLSLPLSLTPSPWFQAKMLFSTTLLLEVASADIPSSPAPPRLEKKVLFRIKQFVAEASETASPSEP